MPSLADTEPSIYHAMRRYPESHPPSDPQRLHS